MLPANLAGGLNGEASLDGVGALTGVGALIVSAVATLSGIGGLTAEMRGKLEAAASLAASGDLTASMGALAGAVSAITADGALTGTARATGALAASITPFTDLSPQSLAAAVWNALVAEYDAAGSFGEAVQSGGGGGGGPSAATIADAVWNEATADHTAPASFGALVQQDIYTAKLAFFDDDGGNADRYVVTWFKNGAVVTSGVTAAALRVVKVVDGSDLIATAAMTEIASLSRFRFDAAGLQRTVAGSAYLAIATATIDGATRTWDQPVGRDS